MKSSERAIERVMAGLRDASASPGMEGRILEAVEGRALVRSRSGWRRLWPVWSMGLAGASAGRSIGWGVVVAGVLAVTLILLSPLRQGHAPMPSTKSLAVSASLPTMAPEIVAESGPPSTSRPGSRLMRTRVWKKAGGRDRSLATVRKARIASQPAPPMLLSDEETEAKAEFQRFFGQPTMQDSE